MASKESQGLQVALILFVMITIALADPTPQSKERKSLSYM